MAFSSDFAGVQKGPPAAFYMGICPADRKQNGET
jgi:hypothetical protein